MSNASRVGDVITPGVVGRLVPRAGRGNAEVEARHSAVVAVLALHLPVILVFGLIRGVVGWTFLGMGLVLAALVGAIVPSRVVVRETSASLGLVAASVTMQAIALGSPETVLHAMLVAILVSLYQDWRIQVATLVAFGLWYVIVGLLDYPAVFGSGSGTLSDVLTRSIVRLGFIAAAMAASRVFWSALERAYRTEAAYREQLHEIEAVGLARLKNAEDMRETLVATVSHEFRTPLTAIQGNTATLLAHGDRLPPEERRRLLEDVKAAGDRLSALLEDMLAAANATGSELDEVADVTAEMHRFAGEPQARSLGIVVRAPDGLYASIRPSALQRILSAFAAHAGENANRGSVAELRGIPEDDRVEISLTYHGTRLSPADMAHLFEPFGSREAARTGRPSSLRLYLVRRLAEVHGGSVAAETSGSRVVLRVHLPAAHADGPVREPSPTSASPLETESPPAGERA